MERTFEPAVNGTDRRLAQDKFLFKPANEEQYRAAEIIRTHDVTFLSGPVGSGKTHVALGVAAEQVLAARYRKIVIVRPLVPAGEQTGFLPGDLGAKLDPWLKGFRDCLECLTFQDPDYFFSKFVEAEAVAMIRGRTLSRCVTIVDEAQNLSPAQTRLVLGRLGRHAKMVLVGDAEQTDTPRRSRYDEFAARLGGMAVEADGATYSVARVGLTRQCRNPLVEAMNEATRDIN